MKQIRTDQGTEYKNEVMQELTKLLKIEHNFSTAYHPQSIGSCEKLHRTLNEYVRAFIDEDRENWDVCCRMCTYCYNTTPNAYHGYTPT